MEDFLVIGIDNGPTGGFCILNVYNDNEVYYFPTPVIKERSYTKKKKYINRLNHQVLKNKLQEIIKGRNCKVYMERPMIQSPRFTASMSAIRCLEAECVILEQLGISYEFLDSKLWQKNILPIGTKGRDNLKLESLKLSIQLFPMFEKEIIKHTDGDSFLIAKYCKENILIPYLQSKEV